jgi:uncharacterized protein YndB with AHSA1/START domain
MDIKASIEISKSPELVFPWLGKPEKAKQWQSNVKTELLENIEYEIGTTFTEIVEENGKSIKLEGVITKYKINKEIAFHLKSKIHELDVEYKIELNKEHSIVEVNANIIWKFPMKLLEFVIGSKMKEGIKSQLNNELYKMKFLCENEYGGINADYST